MSSVTESREGINPQKIFTISDAVTSLVEQNKTKQKTGKRKKRKLRSSYDTFEESAELSPPGNGTLLKPLPNNEDFSDIKASNSKLRNTGVKGRKKDKKKKKRSHVANGELILSYDSKLEKQTSQANEFLSSGHGEVDVVEANGDLSEGVSLNTCIEAEKNVEYVVNNSSPKERKEAGNAVYVRNKESKKVRFEVNSLKKVDYRQNTKYTFYNSSLPSDCNAPSEVMSVSHSKIYTNLVAVGEGHVIFSKAQNNEDSNDAQRDEVVDGSSSKVLADGSLMLPVTDSLDSNNGIKESLTPDTVDTISAHDITNSRNGDSTSSGFTPKEPWDLNIVASPMQDGYHADTEDQNMDKTASLNGSSDAAPVHALNVDTDNKNSNVDYRELAIKLAVEYGRPKCNARKRKYCDFVLVYETQDKDFFHCQDRAVFEKELREQGIDIIRTETGKYTYVELYCSFARLCEEAENIFLQMPLAGYRIKDDDSGSLSTCLSMLNGEHEPAYVTLPFCNSALELFEGVDDHRSFFRPALRSMLVENVLQSIKMNSCEEVADDGVKNVAALNSLLHSGAYKDAFILHERSKLDPLFPVDFEKIEQSEPPSPSNKKKKIHIDRRAELHGKWLSWYRFQPLTKVKDYFGEKIAFYFAWLGMLITSLWIPTFLGLSVFFFGLFTAYNENPVKYETLTVDGVKQLSTKALDNKITPYFALIVCLWGTVFLEIWKRKGAELSFKWDVDDYEFQEPNRPQFYGVRNIKDPFSGTFEPFYPPFRKIFKSLGSMSVILFMILLVLGSVISVITVKVISRVDWFSGSQGTFVSSLMSSVLNSISILVLGKLYRSVAVALTTWENHRTQTQYEDALILKLFGFQFVNSYSSLYYIAFFRERTSTGIFQKGPKYTDDCGSTNDCMSLLSLQVAVLMIMKPLPKFLSDFVLPKAKQVYRILRAKCKRNTVRVDSNCINDSVDPDVEYEDYLNYERRKPPLINFTLSEYTEKVIEYGYLMLFAAAFPLAPLIALVTNLVDLRVDARRLLWLNRRPVAQRAQDIGMWYTILEFLNYVGVVTNAFLVGLTSSFGRNYATSTVQGGATNSTVASELTISSYANLWIVIIFQNIVLAVKFFVAYVIPDVPDQVFRSQKKEKQEVERLLTKAGFRKGPKKTIAPASTSSSARRRGCDDWRKSTDSTYSGIRETNGTGSDQQQQTTVHRFEKVSSSVST